MENRLIHSYLNDGYIYCIHVLGQKTVKIGKTQMKDKYNEEEVLTKLLGRYSTFNADCYILTYIRVGDHHKAEIKVFNLLNDLHYKMEQYIYNETRIKDAFNTIAMLYPNVNTLICENLNTTILSNVNKKLRNA